MPIIEVNHLTKEYRCIVAPNAKVWHMVSVSFGGSGSQLQKYFMTRNKLLWARKHLSKDTRRALHLQSREIARMILVPPFPDLNVPGAFQKRLFWAALTWYKTLRRNLNDRVNKTMLYALRDYYFRRFGDCPPAVRQLVSKPKPPPRD